MVWIGLESKFFQLALAAYAAATVLYVCYLIARRDWIGHSAIWILGLALAAHTANLVCRAYIGHVVLPEMYGAAFGPDKQAEMAHAYRFYVPWSNWHESFSLFAYAIAMSFFIIETRAQLIILGVFILPWVTAAMVMALRSPYGTAVPGLPGSGTAPLMPALQSFWKVIHPPIIFISYALFANAFGVGLAYLIQEWQIKSKRPAEVVFKLPALEELDHLIYRCIAAGFPLLTLGILLGARWAYDAWGTYWQWDAKETASLVTWFVYLIYLHMRLVVGWRGRKTAYMSLIGFAVVLFTFVGVNYLSKLHGFLSNKGA